MDEMPKVLGVTPEVVHVDDDYYICAETSFGAVIVAEDSGGPCRHSARWVPPGAIGEALIGLYDSEEEALHGADAFLRALLAAAVEPIAAKLDVEVRRNAAEETGHRRVRQELLASVAFERMNAYGNAAETVRTFYAEEPS
jgi:hypothetical protein